MDRDTRRGSVARVACGGCLALVLLIVIGGIIAWRYFMGVTPVVPPETFVDAQTRAFVFVRIEDKDLLLIETAREMADRTSAMGSRGTRGLTPEDLEKFSPFPLQIVLTYAPGQEPDKPRVGFAVSLSRGGRIFSKLLGAGAGAKAAMQHDGVPILPDEGGEGYLTAVANTIMVTSDTELAVVWIDRFQERYEALEGLAEDEEPPVPELDATAPLKTAYARLDRDLPVLFAALNTEEELTKLWQEFLEQPDGQNTPEDVKKAADALLDQLISLAAQIKPLDAETAEVTLFAEYPDAPLATSRAAPLQTLLKEKGARQVRIETIEGEGGTTVLKAVAEVQDLGEKLDSWAQSRPQTPQPEPPDPPTPPSP